MNDKLKYLLRLSFSVILFLLGAVIVFIFSAATTGGGLLGKQIGLAFIVAGVVSFFQEAALRPLTIDEVKRGFEKVLDILRGPAIHLETLKRRGYAGYHTWLVKDSPQKVFFAGHSILHRVQDDFGNLPLKTIEEAFTLKLSQGTNIKVLFLDPTWDFLDAVADAQEKGRQDPKELRKNLATSLGVVKRIHDEIEKRDGAMPGYLDIRVCKEVTQYAYHFADPIDDDGDNGSMFVGLYFAGERGTESPLFVVDNSDVRREFEEHFDHIFANAKSLLSYSRGDRNTVFNSSYYRDCQKALAEVIGESEVEKRCP